MKKMLIINPPDFTDNIYEKNLFSKDGLIVINNLLKNYPDIISKTIDFDYCNLGINDLFKEVISYNPDLVYLNLNSYTNYSNFHLCLGIKKFCPNCKIIVGFNISERIKNEISKEIIDKIDYWLDYDLDELKIDSNSISKIKIFNNSYKILFLQNKNNEEIIKEINSNVDNKVKNFIFRKADNLSFEDLNFICFNAKKHFKFVLENDKLNKEQINYLHKKYGCVGIIFDLNENPYFINIVKRTKVFPFARIYLDGSNRKFYECLKNYNLIFLDLVDDVSVNFSKFYKYRYKELIQIYLSEDNIKNNLKFFTRHPIILYNYFKFRKYLQKNKRIYN